MLFRAAIICLMINIIRGDDAVKEEKEEAKTQPSFLSPVRPLPCHSVTMIKDVRPTEFLFIAPGSSGDCSFIFEGLENSQLAIKVRNLKSNLPRGNGDPCEDGQVRLYNYRGSGEVNLSQRLCDNEKEASMLTDSNMAILASSLIDGSFSVVARSLRQVDLLHGSDVNQFLSPPESTNHDWDTKQTNDDSEMDEEIIIDNEPSAFDNSDGSDDMDRSEEETFVNSNMTDTNNTNPENSINCGYDYYGNYICTNLTMNMNETNNSNETDYNPSDYYQSNYQVSSGPYNPQSSYIPPYQQSPTYQAPAPTYAAPKPIYSPPTYNPPIYSAPKPSYQAPNSFYDTPKPTYETPNPTYGAPKPIYEAPNPTYGAPKPNYDAPNPIYKAPEPIYESPKPTYEVPKPIYYSPSNDHGYKPSHTGYDYKPVYEKPFRPSQPIPNNYWAGYKTHSYTNSYDRAPVWYQHRNDYGPYPGKPTKHIDLTHDSYPMYPSYYNPGYYGNNNSTPSTNTTAEPIITTEKPQTKVSRDPTKQVPTTEQPSSTTKHPSSTTKKSSLTTKHPLSTTKKPSSTTKHHHEILGIPIPWTANVTITSGDNLNNSIEDDEDKLVTTTPRFTLNKIIKNLPKLFKQQ